MGWSGYRRQRRGAGRSGNARSGQVKFRARSTQCSSVSPCSARSTTQTTPARSRLDRRKKPRNEGKPVWLVTCDDQGEYTITLVPGGTFAVSGVPQPKGGFRRASPTTAPQ